MCCENIKKEIKWKSKQTTDVVLLLVPATKMHERIYAIRFCNGTPATTLTATNSTSLLKLAINQARHYH